MSLDTWLDLIGVATDNSPTLGEGAMQGLGRLDFAELFQPKPVGEAVNVHVTAAIREPMPDYAAMQRLIVGSDKLVVSKEENK